MTQAILLIGGASKRMGQAKSLLMRRGKPLGQVLCEQLQTVTGAAPVLLGKGSIGPGTDRYRRIADREPGMGPLSALLGAFDQLPRDEFLVVACDLWAMRVEALNWVMQVDAGDASVVWPRFQDRAHGEPLCSRYLPSSRKWLEAAWQDGTRSLLDAVPLDTRCQPLIPPEFTAAFTSVNRPDQLEQLRLDLGSNHSTT